MCMAYITSCNSPQRLAKAWFNAICDLRKKKASLRAHLWFLTRCRNAKVIPKFIKVTTKLPKVNDIIHEAAMKILRRIIRVTRSRLSTIEAQLYKAHLQACHELHRLEWNKIDITSHNLADKTYARQHRTQVRKLFLLQQCQTPKIRTNNTTANLNSDTQCELFNITKIAHDKILTNEKLTILTVKPIDTAITHLLNKGKNFALTPHQIPTETIICNLEEGIKLLSENDKNAIRVEIGQILRHKPTFRPNFNTQSKVTLNKLLDLNDVTVVPADKGNSLVIMDMQTYTDKIKLLLNDPTYVTVKNNPTQTRIKALKNILNTCEFPPNIKRLFLPSNPQAPKLYGTCKIHKIDQPLRPIISNINGPTQHISRALTDLLTPTLNKTYTVDNSIQFIDKLKQHNITPNDHLVSFDVTSLFTKIPIQQTISIIKNRLDNLSLYTQTHRNNILKLLNTTLECTYFQYNNTYYIQTDGAAMGSSLSSFLADTYMEHLEEVIFTTLNPKPSLWIRYVDDIFAIWPHGTPTLQTFLNQINSLSPTIKFTTEHEQNRHITFLDVSIYRNSEHFDTTIHRKPTNTTNLIHNMSAHHPSHKLAFYTQFVRRAHKICSNTQLYDQELNFIRQLAQANGIKLDTINNIIKKTNHRIKYTPVTKLQAFETKPRLKIPLPYIPHVTNKIGRVLKKFNISLAHIPGPKIKHVACKLKDRTPPDQKSGVYIIPCECEAVYIGQTRRSLAARRTEHSRCLRLGRPLKSSVAQHAIENNHSIKWDASKIIAQTKTNYTRLVRESIEIIKHPVNFNSSDGFKLPVTWSALFHPRKANADLEVTQRPTAVDHAIV